MLQSRDAIILRLCADLDEAKWRVNQGNWSDVGSSVSPSLHFLQGKGWWPDWCLSSQISLCVQTYPRAYVSRAQDEDVSIHNQPTARVVPNPDPTSRGPHATAHIFFDATWDELVGEKVSACLSPCLISRHDMHFDIAHTHTHTHTHTHRALVSPSAFNISPCIDTF